MSNGEISCQDPMIVHRMVNKGKELSDELGEQSDDICPQIKSGELSLMTTQFR